MSDETETSLFSKQKIKSTMGKWAGKISEKLNSPPNRPYEKFDESITQSQDVLETTSTDQQREQKNMKSKGQVSSDSAADMKSSDRDAQNQRQSSDATTKRSNAEINKGGDYTSTKVDTKKTKNEWRSAIDGATGRTYYYVKGTSAVTWQKPTDF